MSGQPSDAKGSLLPKLIVCVASQRLFLYDAHGVCQRIYPISTAAKGVGQVAGSEQTPLGRHRIRAVIGRGMPLGTVFRARRPTRERVRGNSLLHARGHDLILTRILWLCGEEVGWNRLGAVDTQRRFIYLHGTQDEAHLGEPHSHGCIRMGNSDIAELAMLAPPGTRVWIVTQWPR